jgi:DNA-binding NarL/FixJ family response regulator
LDAKLFEGKNTGQPQLSRNRRGDSGKKQAPICCKENADSVQQKRLLMLADGLSLREIARVEGVDHRAVRESIDSAKKKIKKVF